MASPSRTFAMQRSVFVRPSNMWLSHPLQALQIISFMARSTGGKVLRFRAVREPEQQRMLNFASITFESPALAVVVCKDSLKFHVPFNSRMASDFTSLMTRNVQENRGIGLKEIAPLVDLDLEIGNGLEEMQPSPPQEVEATARRSKNGSIPRAVLASVREPVHDNVFNVELKLERRTEPDVPYKANALNGINLAKRDAEHYRALQYAADRFKGFGGKLSAASFSEPIKSVRKPRGNARHPQHHREHRGQSKRQEEGEGERWWRATR